MCDNEIPILQKPLQFWKHVQCRVISCERQNYWLSFLSFSTNRREGITEEQDTVAQREMESLEPEISGSGNYDESLQAQKLAENLALNKIPLVRAPVPESVIVKRRNFGRKEERRSTGFIDTTKRSKIDKPTVKAAKEKPTAKSNLEEKKKTESLSDGASLPKSAVKEGDSATNTTSTTPVEGLD